jgi:hypothetical protein
MKQILKFLKWVKHLLWDKAVEEPAPEEKYKLKLTDVSKEWIVIHYHGQMVNLHINEYPLWKALDRKDKRAMANRFKILEEKGQIRFENIDGKFICIKNKTYGSKNDN